MRKQLAALCRRLAWWLDPWTGMIEVSPGGISFSPVGEGMEILCVSGRWDDPSRWTTVQQPGEPPCHRPPEPSAWMKFGDVSEAEQESPKPEEPKNEEIGPK